MVGPQTKATGTKVLAQEAWELLGPFLVGRITMITLAINTQAQFDSAANSGGALTNRRRVRIWSMTVPGTTALQATVGFDTSVAAAVGAPIWNNGLPLEMLADQSVPILIFAVVAGTFAMAEEATG